MKQVIIGDIHGRSVWKEIVAKEKDADRVIFIGDYFDTHEDILPIEQLSNFEDICKWTRECGKDVKMLIGNHDHHYWPGVQSTCSGYQPAMRDSFGESLIRNKDLLSMCFVDEYATIYSHAGFTKTFIREKIGSFSQEHVNDVWRYKPNTFNFYHGDWSGCGDDIHQSNIWVRPGSLYKDQLSNLQVVGHTGVNNINHPAKSERRGFYLIDCLHNRQYLVRNDEEFEIKRLDKATFEFPDTEPKEDLKQAA